MINSFTENNGGLENSISLLIDLDGFEGPLDVLLTLARKQKVDLTKLSILTLADQYSGIRENQHLSTRQKSITHNLSR